MFTIEQINEAHSKVKTGAEFPAYIQDLYTIGVAYYETHVKDGHTDYFSKDNYILSSDKIYEDLSIAGKTDASQFQKDLKEHQKGKTDYITFCNDCAKSGIEKWIVNIEKKTCVYYDKTANEVLTEAIPTI